MEVMAFFDKVPSLKGVVGESELAQFISTLRAVLIEAPASIDRCEALEADEALTGEAARAVRLFAMLRLIAAGSPRKRLRTAAREDGAVELFHRQRLAGVLPETLSAIVNAAVDGRDIPSGLRMELEDGGIAVAKPPRAPPTQLIPPPLGKLQPLRRVLGGAAMKGGSSPTSPSVGAGFNASQPHSSIPSIPSYLLTRRTAPCGESRGVTQRKQRQRTDPLRALRSPAKSVLAPRSPSMSPRQPPSSPALLVIATPEHSNNDPPEDYEDQGHMELPTIEICRKIEQPLTLS